MQSNYKKIIECGVKAGDVLLCHEDRIWSRYSNDKVDIGEELTKVIRTLSKALPLGKEMRALSIGSSAEPQFRILETAFRGGLYLLDIEEAALDIVKERIHRQYTKHVNTLRADFNKIFLNSENTKKFLEKNLYAHKMDLITLHHSLYYAKAIDWPVLFENLYKYVLAQRGALHSVLMASKSDDQYSTTWLYNHFAGKYFDVHNDQDLAGFKRVLSKYSVFNKAQILTKTHCVYFFADDFGKFMCVVWMILLYPNVHKYSLKQREEITEFMYKKFWLKKRPLEQMQDHMVIYRGVPFRGLI